MRRSKRQFGEILDHEKLVRKQEVASPAEDLRDREPDYSGDAGERDEKHRNRNERQNQNIHHHPDDRDLPHHVQDVRRDEYLCGDRRRHYSAHAELFRNPSQALFDRTGEQDEAERRQK